MSHFTVSPNVDIDIDPTSSSTFQFASNVQVTQSLIGRPRKRKFLALGLVALILLLLFYFRKAGTSYFSNQQWNSEAPYSLPHSHNLSQTTTIAAPTIAETKNIYHHTKVRPEPVVFFLIVWSGPSAKEAAILLKSILLYNSSPSELHIICDDSAQRYLEERLSLITRPLHDIDVRFYTPSWQSMLDRVEREGSIKTDHSAGLPGLMKLFIHEILPQNVTRGIYVDTDSIFIADPTLLWNVFENLKPSTAIVMSSHPDQDSPEWHHASRICSCIMLLNLEKMRAMRMMDSSIYREDHSGKYPPSISPPAFRAKYGLPGGDGHGRYENVRLGDQGYWWAIVDYRPDIFEPLSYDFEVTSCLLDTYMTGLGDDSRTESEELSRQVHTKNTPQEGVVVLPKLLHFNCLHGTPIYMDWDGWSDPNNSLNIRWGAAVAYHVGLKWIWLNKSYRSTQIATLKMSTYRDVIFSDQQFSRVS